MEQNEPIRLISRENREPIDARTVFGELAETFKNGDLVQLAETGQRWRVVRG